MLGDFILKKHERSFKNYIIFALIFVSVFSGVLCAVSYKSVMSSYYINALDDSQKSGVNILAAGIDDMSISADAIVVANVNPEKDKITIVSVPSETIVKIIDTNHPLKNVYSIGGTDMLVQKTAEILGIDINYYICTKFSAFENVIDILGGVEFNVPYDMQYQDKKQGLKINLKKGKQTLDGEKALKLLRFTKSKTDLANRENVTTDFFKACIDQKLNNKHFSKITSAAKEVMKNTKTNLLSYDIDAYSAIAKSVMSKNIEIKKIEGKINTTDGYSFFYPDELSVKSIFSSGK